MSLGIAFVYDVRLALVGSVFIPMILLASYTFDKLIESQGKMQDLSKRGTRVC